VAKEILWGIGTGRRNDDALIDGRQINKDDMLFYYRRATRARMLPGVLQTSIANAEANEYQYVDFDKSPISMALLIKVILTRYIVFPIRMWMLALSSHVGHPSAGLLNQIVMTFLAQTVEWEIFLDSHLPRLHLSHADMFPSHIAETVAFNLNGVTNGAFQWADHTGWRSVPLAYLGYNIYFGWGALPAKHWQGNWVIDQVFHIGYIWGHHYQESMAERDELRKALLGSETPHRFVISLFDEVPSPTTFTSSEMFLDFYRVGTALLEKRPDTIVVAKPKAFEGVREHPEILELIDPYVRSGRFHVWDHNTADPTQLMAMSDVVVSFVMGVPYLEAICCGRRGFNYAPSRNLSSPLYAKGHGKIVFDDLGDLVDAIDRALDHPEESPSAALGDLMEDVDPFRDFRGMERMRIIICELTADVV